MIGRAHQRSGSDQQPLPDQVARDTELARLVALSVSFRDHGTEERERLGTAVASLGPFAECCLIQTCLRSELIALSDEIPTVDARVFRGRDAVQRVFVLAAGLDSAIVAEEQVLGQVRDAHSLALARGETGPVLNELFRRAVRFGKHVRSLAQPTADRSLAEHAAGWAIARLAPDGHRSGALVVGTGEMGRSLATRFAASGIPCTIASRRPERAANLADRLPSVPGRRHTTADIEQVAGLLPSHALLAVAVRRSTPLLHAHDVAAAAIDVIDLSAPAALTSDAEALLGDRLLNLDRLGNRQAASVLSPRAEREVRERLEAETDRYVAWLIARRHGPAAALHREAEALRAKHLERLRIGVDLTAAQLAAVENMTAALVGELVHLRGEEAREELLTGSPAS